MGTLRPRGQLAPGISPLSTHHHRELQGFRPNPDGHKSKSTQKGLPAETLVTPSQSLPTVRERRSREGWLNLSFWKHLLLWLPAGLPWMIGKVVHYKSHLATEVSGPEILATGQGASSAQRLLFCNCLLGGDTFVWWALGTLRCNRFFWEVLRVC